MNTKNYLNTHTHILEHHHVQRRKGCPGTLHPVGTKEEMTRMRNSFPELKAHLPTRRAKTIEAARFRQEFCKTKGISLKHHCLLSCDVCGDYGFSSNARSKGKNQSWQKWCEVCEESYVSGKKRHDKCCMKCGFTFRDANNGGKCTCGESAA